MDCSPSGSSVHGFSQARILEWLPFPSPGDLPDPEMDPPFPAWQVGSLPLSHQGSPQHHSLSLGYSPPLAKRCNSTYKARQGPHSLFSWSLYCPLPVPGSCTLPCGTGHLVVRGCPHSSQQAHHAISELRFLRGGCVASCPPILCSRRNSS